MSDLHQQRSHPPRLVAKRRDVEPVLPHPGRLSALRQLPPGGAVSTVTMSDGWPVRLVSWPARGASRGTLLFLNGRADFIEKYYESYHDFLDWGFALTTIDWRGQGGSGRLGVQPHMGHARDFERWVDDLSEIVARLGDESAGPLVAAGHSMGGHILLRHLARGGSPIARAALLSPMLGIRIAPPPMLHLARAMTALGLGGRYALLQRGYGPHLLSPRRTALLSASPERLADKHQWIAEDPSLALGGVTWGWLAAASMSLGKLLARGVLESISIPTITIVGALERLVDASPARRLAHGSYHVIPDGRHELLRELDPARDSTLALLKGFLAP